jgi:hypothetical protein
MIEEVYYKELDENYEGKGRRTLPYVVKCKDEQELEEFIQYLTDKSFSCADQIIGQRALLVNLELRRWCSFPKACAMSCKDGKTYTVEEFKKLYYSVRKFPYTSEIIEHYRKDFYKALLNIKEKGRPCLTEEQAKRIVDSFSDDALAYDMQFHTPEELADINTM